VLSGAWTLSAALDEFIGECPGPVLEEVIHGIEKQLGDGASLLPEPGDVVDWDEVRRMAKGGMELGAHTQTHRGRTMESHGVMEQEVRGSQAAIEGAVGYPVRDFAYCNGWYSDELVQILRRAGFRSAVTTEDVPNRLGGDPFLLKRKVLWENFSVGA